MIYGNDKEGTSAEELATFAKAQNAIRSAQQVTTWMWQAMPFHPQADRSHWDCILESDVDAEHGTDQNLREACLDCAPQWLIAAWMLEARETRWHGQSWPERDLCASIAGHLHGETIALGDESREFARQLAEQAGETFRAPDAHGLAREQRDDSQAVVFAAMRQLENKLLAQPGWTEETARVLDTDQSQSPDHGISW